MQRRILALLVLLGSIFQLGITKSYAQQPNIDWSEPVNISLSQSSSQVPAIVADEFGKVHVFWSEEINGKSIDDDELPTVGNTLLYRQWDGHHWSEPVDILHIDNQYVSHFPKVVIDKEQRIHLIWTGLKNIYYSNVLAELATSPHAWLEPQVISHNSARTQWESSVSVDQDNVVHVAFATRNEKGVKYRRSTDNGATWSVPKSLHVNFSGREVWYSTIHILAESEQHIHVAWRTGNDNGYGERIYYVRSIDGGITWEEPTLIQSSVGEESFVNYAYFFHDRFTGELLLVYEAETTKGRIQLTSVDHGETWAEKNRIIKEMEGSNGYVFPLQDASGQLHMITNMRPSATQQTGIYVSSRDERGRWLQTIPAIANGEIADTAHQAAGTVRVGNELHVVWTQLVGAEVWHTIGHIQDVVKVLPKDIYERASEEENIEQSSELTKETKIDDIEQSEKTHLFSTAHPADSNNQFLVTIGVALSCIIIGVVARQTRYR